jgi:hypothetical protein
MLRRRQAGSATLEVLILVPILFALMNVALYAGQVRMIHSLVREAAQASARQASIARTKPFSSTPVIAGYIANGDADLICTGPNGDPGFSPGWGDSLGVNGFLPQNTGHAESVRMTIICKAPIRLINAPGVVQYITFTESAWSVIDPYRYRSRT